MGNSVFSLGPISLEILGGELVFLVGENGAGKTTFIKLLLGLYSPDSGSIYLNGNLVTADNLDDYRQHFSTVFSDDYLFDDLSPGMQVHDTEMLRYLTALQLAHKVSIDEGRFTTIDLSMGQRKRLALFQAWHEARPVLVFDEWAADQDPVFRKLFYTELLPEFKKSGRTVIAISHDDRYFHVADRVLEFREGKLFDLSEDARVSG